jgi:acetylornithine/N-succinyldiaminopimelate aminotransferase
VRGEGLMIGLKCRVPNTDVVARLRANRMLTAGAGDNVVRLLPPLIIDDRHIEEGLGILEHTVAAWQVA